MFIGREHELGLLAELLDKKTASLVICQGRRRIGKSRLIQEFSRKTDVFLEFQGLPPRENASAPDQLKAFSQQLSSQTTLPELTLQHWPQAFSLLSSVIDDKKRTLVLLDEISWMAATDKDFAGHLKIAWDTDFCRKSKLILVLCGSVSSWIDKNILNNTGFVGRISQEITPGELPLHHCVKFWGRRAERISDMDKLKMLSITGGVPRYLEEMNAKLSADENIRRLCFRKEGFLFSEFQRIFHDIFSRRAPTYVRILKALISGSKTFSDICKDATLVRCGRTTDYLNDLIASGFLAKDTVFNPAKTSPTRRAKYRVCDNYVRFYLKHVESMKERIQTGLLKDAALNSFLNWDSIIGLHFENLVLNNVEQICTKLNLPPGSVLSASPFFQRQTQRTSACQIDLLIQTRHTLYVCEIKFRPTVGRDVIRETQEKIMRLRYPKHMSIRPVFIYAGIVTNEEDLFEYFDACISFADLLTLKTS